LQEENEKLLLETKQKQNEFILKQDQLVMNLQRKEEVNRQNLEDFQKK